MTHQFQRDEEMTREELNILLENKNDKTTLDQEKLDQNTEDQNISEISPANIPSNDQTKSNGNSFPICFPIPVCCDICQCSLVTTSALMYHRMFHISQRFNNITDIITFCIKGNEKKIKCIICDYTMSNEDDLDNHLRSICHEKRLLILCSPNSGAIMNMISLNSALHPQMTLTPNMNIYNTLNEEYQRYFYYYNFFCNT